jgi:homospermidine synthase
VALGVIRGKLVLVGYGSIGKGTLPLILERFSVAPERVTVVAPNEEDAESVRSVGATWITATLNPANFEEILGPLLWLPGSFLVNLSVGVSSLELIRLARQHEALYLDTCIEPWDGFYLNQALSASERSNYTLRQQLVEEQTMRPSGDPTAVLCMGANPGLASIFVKVALMNLNRDLGLKRPRPQSKTQWAQLAADLGVQGIHIAERDTQIAGRPKRHGEFVNTWSVDGFLSEGIQPAELGWGTFEPWRPSDAHDHTTGECAAIYLERPGCAVRVWTWTPMEGPTLGYLITHNEAISIADYLTLRKGGEVTYRPTVHYAYHPCDDAVLSIHELLGCQLHPQKEQRILHEEIVSGADELGVLLYGHAKNAYWFGSRLDIDEARRLAALHNATGLQVAAGILAGMAWALSHPLEGIVEAEALDEVEAMRIAEPYLGKVVGEYTDWHPLKDRTALLPGNFQYPEVPWAFCHTLLD